MTNCHEYCSWVVYIFLRLFLAKMFDLGEEYMVGYRNMQRERIPIVLAVDDDAVMRFNPFDFKKNFFDLLRNDIYTFDDNNIINSAKYIRD